MTDEDLTAMLNFARDSYRADGGYGERWYAYDDGWDLNVAPRAESVLVTAYTALRPHLSPRKVEVGTLTREALR